MENWWWSLLENIHSIQDSQLSTSLSVEPSSGLMLTALVAHFILMSFSLWYSSSSLCFKVVTWLKMASLFRNELSAAHCSVIRGCRSSAVYKKTTLILAAQLSALQLATLMTYCIISTMNWINVFKGLTEVHFKQSGNTICFTGMNWWKSNHFWLRQQFSSPPACPGYVSSGWGMQANQHFGSIKVRMVVNSAQLYKQTCCLASIPFGASRKSETTAALMVKYSHRGGRHKCLESLQKWKHFESVTKRFSLLEKESLLTCSSSHSKVIIVKLYTSQLLIHMNNFLLPCCWCFCSPRLLQLLNLDMVFCLPNLWKGIGEPQKEILWWFWEHRSSLH